MLHEVETFIILNYYSVVSHEASRSFVNKFMIVSHGLKDSDETTLGHLLLPSTQPMTSCLPCVKCLSSADEFSVDVCQTSVENEVEFNEFRNIAVLCTQHG